MTAFWRRWRSGDAHAPVRQPLLNRQEVARILAHSRRADALAGARASEFAAGDIPTRRAGSGMEFDDNRVYAHGDDARHINWRLTARTGTPYVKVFQEERRPCAFVVLDRRAGMRFATVGRLKVTQAAVVALRFAAAAVERGTPVGALVLDRGVRWLEPRHGETGLRVVLDAAVAAAPPLEAASAPALADTLNHLAVRLRPGCDLLLLSDFADLDDDCTPHLVRLGTEHRLRAVRISDPAETTLPDAGVMEFAARDGTFAVDTHLPRLRSAFRERAQREAQAQRARFSAAGVQPQSLSTEDDALALPLTPPRNAT